MGISGPRFRRLVVFVRPCMLPGLLDRATVGTFPFGSVWAANIALLSSRVYPRLRLRSPTTLARPTGSLR